jgi:hypothetical protein
VTPNLIEPMATKPCICATCIIEQKVREACGFTGSEPLTTAELEALLNGVARVFVEVTARLSEPAFHLAVQWLVIRRESLREQPSVMIHISTPVGRA